MRAQPLGFRFLQWVALRQLVSSRSRRGLSFMTIFSIIGVTLGVAALVVVLSVMGGFARDLKEKMLRGQAHAEVIHQNAIAGFSLQEYPVKKIAQLFSDATVIAPFVQSDVVMKQGKHLAAANLYGVRQGSDTSIWAFHDTLIEGNLEDIHGTHSPLVSVHEDEGSPSKFSGIVLGVELAGQMGANIGDEIVILSPEARTGLGILTGGTISRTYVLVGIFQSGLFNYDSKWAVTSIDEARRFMPGYDSSLDVDDYVTGIALNSKTPEQIENWRLPLRQTFPDLALRTWEDMNSALLFALELEKYTMGAILMLIVLVAAFSISGTMMMTVFHKRSQVSLLRSLGLSRSRVAWLFVLQGLAVGLTGVFGGLVLGLSILKVIELSHDFGLTSYGLAFRSLPVRYLPFEYAFVCTFALLLSILAALYPALIASRQNPSSGLRYS